MRAPLLAAVCLGSALLELAVTSRADEPDLTPARVLDREGVRSFQAGRYRDAIRYFRRAYELGAPSSELWNVARCYLKLDEAEQAAAAIERYLAQADLSAADRGEAKWQLDELRRRHSVLTIASPAGARITIDGRPMYPRAPLSVDLAPGTHTVLVESEGTPPYAADVEAKLGRSILIEADKEEPRAAGVEHVEVGPRPYDRVPPFSVSAEVGALWARLGALPAPAHPAVFVGVSYALLSTSKVVVGAGLRATLTEDTWGNGVAAPGPAGCTVPNDELATSVSLFLAGAIGYRATSRLRVGGDFGIGAAAYSASEVGGDLFTPTCNAPTGLRPALHVGTEASYALLPSLRIVASPAVVELQSAFGGARTTPIDASGPWLRLGMALGLALDL